MAILPFLLLASLPAHAQMVTISPAQIGEIFCIGSLGNDMAPVEALLTPQLTADIAEAWARSAAFEAANPGDKPPLGDGLPWRTYPDYADACTVGDIAVSADTAKVNINYGFTSQPTANYTNTLHLQLVEVSPGMQPFWRIDDIDLDDDYTMRFGLREPFID